ncbi:MAG: protein kinase [Anaerolineae bacterium]|nr:protein kinase [Anaerolineae bacterium]MDW8171749.1 protein kinase [Anaerolineae bacterium]
MEIGASIHGQYTIIEHIGRGGMADVWSAQDTRLRRMVAIKTIAAALSQDADPLEMFRREAQTIAQIEHPHILPIYDFGDYQGRLYIVMRYVSGGSLEGMLQRGRMSVDEVLRMGRQIAQALDHAHSQKVIHLDLKPPNILLDSARTPYLADFGLATVLDREGRARNPGSGTLLYMAPEQITAETVDHRADVYAFAIMLYHMLKGALPFDGAQPLAIRQLQYNDQLPDFDPQDGYPDDLIEVLRQATSREPSARHDSHTALMDDLQAVLAPDRAIASFNLDNASLEGDDPLGDALLDTVRSVGLADSDLLEAIDLYTRARHTWAGGQGRFLLGLTHFLIVANVYRDAERYGLALDEMGRQMLLRGALEYDHDLALWWEQNDEAARRLACLHAIRTGSTAARLRALAHLETLADDPKQPSIARLVAQALEVERDDQARIAALRVLATRAALTAPQQEYQLPEDARGRLLTTLSRLGIVAQGPRAWRDAVYSPEIDLLVAEQALDTEHPQVADFAARVIGQMRSLTALRALARQQQQGRPGALRALALVRDEVSSLPDLVAPQARAYAWMTNSLRRLSADPLGLILRFALALLGGWIAFGQQVYITYRAQALFTPQRWGNALSIGLVMGLFIALTVLLADEASRRLRGFWPAWARALVWLPSGLLMGMLSWAAFTWFYLGGSVNWELVRMGGVGLGLGFGVVALLGLRGPLAVGLAALSFYLPLYAAYRNQCSQLYLCFDEQGNLLSNFSPVMVGLIGLGLGGLVGLLWRRQRNAPSANSAPWPQKIGLGLAGLAWAALSWAALGHVLNTRLLSWDGVMAFFALGFLPSLMAALLADGRAALAFFAAGGGLFVGLSQIVGDPFAQVLVAPQAGAAYVEALLSYDQAAQVLTVGLPLALVIALFPYLPYTYASLLAWIGQPHKRHAERDAWHNLALLLLLGLGTLVSVFALFSLHADPVWAIAWSAWGFGLFVATLAVGQWARWGGLALIGLGGLGLLGALAHDWRVSVAITEKTQALPPLFRAEALLAALVLGGLLVLAALGLWRRRVWSGALWLLGLVLALLLLIFTPQGSATLLALALLGLVVFAMRPYWSELEAGRWRWVTPPQQASIRLEARQPLPPPNLRTIVRSDQMATLPNAANFATLLNAASMATTEVTGFSANSPVVTFDKATPSSEPPPTQAYAAPPVSQPPTQAKPPSMKFDLSAVGGSATELDPQSSFSAPQSTPVQAKPPSIKFDFSNLQTKPAPLSSSPDAPEDPPPSRSSDEG